MDNLALPSLDLHGGSGDLNVSFTNAGNQTNETEKDYGENICVSQAKPASILAANEIFIAALGLIFNGIAIFVIIRLKDYKKVVSHWYVLHLSIADVLLLLHLPFKASEHIKGYWNYPEWFCVINQGIFMMSYYAGILFLTVMSFDRYVAIVHPVSVQWRRLRTRYIANIVTLLVWVLSFILALPLWIFSKAGCLCGFDFSEGESLDEDVYYKYMKNNEEYLVEMEASYGKAYFDSVEFSVECRHKESYSFFAWMLSNFIITFVLPIIIMVICYSLILWRVLHPAISSTHTVSRRHRRPSDSCNRKESYVKSSFRTSSSSSSSSHRLSRKGKVTLVVASLVACFLICWCPFHLVHLIKLTSGLPFGSEDSCIVMNTITHILAYSNSMLNPILYTFLGSDFRRRLNSATKSLRPRRTSGFSKSNRTARVSAPTYGRSAGTGTLHKAMEGPSYPMNTIHSIVSKHYSQDLQDKSQLLSTKKKECSSRCEDALQFSDVSESRLIH